MEDLALIGPRTADAACTLGEPCTVQLLGSGLALTNSLRVVAAGALCTAPRQNMTGLLSPAAAASVNTWANASTHVLGTVTQGVAGRYELCWRHDDAGEYTFVGSLHFKGASFGSFACKLGSPCVLSPHGTGFEETNGVLLTDGACGDPAAHVTESARAHSYYSS